MGGYLRAFAQGDARPGKIPQGTGNTLPQYKDLVIGGDVSGVEAVRPGEGAVVRKGTTKLGVYRDETSSLHVRSAVCTDLGCVIDWNPAEKSRDGPCHSLRFDTEGWVLHEPAALPLGPKTL